MVDGDGVAGFAECAGGVGGGAGAGGAVGQSAVGLTDSGGFIEGVEGVGAIDAD